MSGNLNEKFVDFHKYCPKCVNYEKDDGDDPCNSCMMEPVNLGSTEPVLFESKEE